jgi:hypothetical protein
MKKLLLAVALLLIPVSLQAESGPIGPKQFCVPLDNPLIATSAMTSSRSFTINRPNLMGGVDYMMLYIKLVDADASITRFDVTCTASEDGGTTVYTPQECTTAGGTATCVDAGVWQKASPGTKNWRYKLRINGSSDWTCTFSVGTGAATAVIDTVQVDGRICTG